MDVGEYGCGFGRDGNPAFWVSTFAGVGPNREVHVAFQAADAAAVRAFHEAAVGAGAESLHAPRMWPEYHPGYYGAFVRDLEGNNIEAVCHSASPKTVPGPTTEAGWARAGLTTLTSALGRGRDVVESAHGRPHADV